MKASNKCSVKCNDSKYTAPREENENPTEEACQVRKNLSYHSTTWRCLSAEIQVTGIDVFVQLSSRSPDHRPLNLRLKTIGDVRQSSHRLARVVAWCGYKFTSDPIADHTNPAIEHTRLPAGLVQPPTTCHALRRDRRHKSKKAMVHVSGPKVPPTHTVTTLDSARFESLPYLMAMKLLLTGNSLV